MENFILNEICQTQMDKYCIISLNCVIYNVQLIERERIVVIRCWGFGNWGNVDHR